LQYKKSSFTGCCGAARLIAALRLSSVDECANHRGAARIAGARHRLARLIPDGQPTLPVNDRNIVNCFDPTRAAMPRATE
jgi:hypothetical protein